MAKQKISARKGSDKRTKLRVPVQVYQRNEAGKGHYNEVSKSAIIIEVANEDAVAAMVARIQKNLLGISS